VTLCIYDDEISITRSFASPNYRQLILQNSRYGVKELGWRVSILPAKIGRKKHDIRHHYKDSRAELDIFQRCRTSRGQFSNYKFYRNARWSWTVPLQIIFTTRIDLFLLAGGSPNWRDPRRCVSTIYVPHNDSPQGMAPLFLDLLSCSYVQAWRIRE